jgi:hypothetical protein
LRDTFADAHRRYTSYINARLRATGRPLGSDDWMEKLEKMTGRTLKPQRRGPKKRDRYVE